MSLYVEYLMLTRVRVFWKTYFFFLFFFHLLIQSVAFPFLVLILCSKFTQFPFVFINKIGFLELTVCPKYLTEILKILTESFFAETFRY